MLPPSAALGAFAEPLATEGVRVRPGGGSPRLAALCQAREMTDRTRTTPRPVDSRAIASAGAAVLGALLVGVPLLASALAVVAIVLALGARGRLRADETLRGARVSLVGFVLGLGVLAVALSPLVLGWVLGLFA